MQSISVAQRPREIRWYHAAGMLFGDWGTSRLYVLGLVFVAAGHASFWYVAAMCVLMSLVGLAYTVICAHFPDGGGVYSAAKSHSRVLAVVGALLLLADYIVTAALSAYEGFRYLLPTGVPADYAWFAALVAILAMGLLNVFGARRVGVLALGIAVLSVVFYVIIGLFCRLHFGDAVIHRPTESVGMQWSHFVNVILALSGVETIANMTGIMAEPVAKNARRAIFVVLLEIVVLNLVMAYAMNALPQFRGVEAGQVTGPDGNAVAALIGPDGQPLPQEVRDGVRDHMVKTLAETYVGGWFANVASIFFGLLLVSAANTAIGGMVSVQYLLGRDRELPRVFTSLNRFGVPWMGLIVATAAPIIVLIITGAETETLAGLYAIGVVGAITINLCACGTNRELVLKRWERALLLGVGALAVTIELTIACEKPSALLFACLVLTAGLLARHVAQRRLAPVPAAAPLSAALAEAAELEAPVHVPAEMPRVLMPTRGNPKLFTFAVRYAQKTGSALYVLFVREVSLAFRERGAQVASETMTLDNDREARQVFTDIKRLCDEAGVPMVTLYAVHDSPGELILDNAALLGVDAVLMGVSKRGALWKTLRGDVLQDVISHLPPSIELLIHA